MTDKERSESAPYIFDIAFAKKHLRYFGVLHSNNASDLQWPLVKKQFLEISPEVIAIESMPQVSISLSPAERTRFLDKYRKAKDSELIQAFGERGLGISLAASANIDLVSLDPLMAEEVRHLEGLRFDRDLIFARYVFRRIMERRFNKSTCALEEYIMPYISELQEKTGWLDFEFSWSHAQRIASRIWGSFEPENYDLMATRVWPDTPITSPYFSVINEVAAASNRYRDKRIIERISQLFEAFSQVFVLYGKSHALMQEESLRQLLTINPDSKYQGRKKDFRDGS